MSYQLLLGDCRDSMLKLPGKSVQCCVTSPPYYGLRDYGHDGQIGLEATPEEYVAQLVDVFRCVRNVLKDDGTLWVNLGDSYNGSGGPGGWADNKQTDAFKGEFRKYNNPNRDVKGLKPKDLIGIPWMVAFALRADGWFLRADIIWDKPSVMPESVKDRPTKSHEYIFLLSKSREYFYDSDAIREEASESSLARINQPNFANQTGGPKDYRNGINPNRSMRQTVENFAKNPGRNKRSVWRVATRPYSGAHFATYPPELIEPCILAGSRPGDTVLDPFNGSGTTGFVACNHKRDYIGCELNPEYIELAHRRIQQSQSSLLEVT